MIKILPANLHDIDSIIELHKESLSIYPWSYDRNYIRNAIEYGNFYVIKDDKILIGAIKVRLYASVLLISNIAIKKDYRNKGYGTKLITYISKIAKSRCNKIRLETLEKSKADKFYIKSGFVVVEQEKYRDTIWRRYEKTLNK